MDGCMELTAEQLQKLKAIEVEMLKSFIHACEMIGVKYYLLGGTLLGAVRHRGFIPWDDDIDIGMMREDYERFIKEGQALMPEGYFIQNFHSDPNYPANFSKIRNCNTTFIETSVRNCDINHGIFIDVFPLDYYPDNRVRQRILEFKKRALNHRIASVFYLPNRKKTPLIQVARLLLFLRYPSHKRAVKAREKLYTSCKNGKYIANYGGAWGVKEIVPANWYGDGCMLEFEGLQTRAPLEYKKWLSQVYGDYMTLPPVEKRVGHHYVDVIDFEKSYKEYVSSRFDL